MNTATESPPDEVRIVVRRNGPVSSIQYRGSDPETRYIPRDLPPWARFKENIRLAFARPHRSAK